MPITQLKKSEVDAQIIAAGLYTASTVVPTSFSQSYRLQIMAIMAQMALADAVNAANVLAQKRLDVATHDDTYLQSCLQAIATKMGVTLPPLPTGL